ncbi:MAG: hypothetical protein C0423_18850 [Methylibium sp.]|nr:hypothetical protein [Methylibium sp.]
MTLSTLLALIAAAASLVAAALWLCLRRRGAREHMAWVFDASPVAMALVDPLQGYRLVDANPQWYQQFGLSAGQAVGRNGQELNLWIDPQDRARLIAALTSAGSETALDAQLRVGDSEQRWFRICARRVLSRRRDWAVLSMQDIQAQRELEQTLRDSEAVALQLFDVVPETLLISDAKTGEFIDINRAWASKMGYTKQQVIGKTSRDLNLWVDMNAVAAMGRRFGQNGQVDGEQLDMRRADGSILNFEVSARQWQSSSRHLSIWVARDITEHRRAEQALRELNATLEERVALRTRELADALEVVQRAQDELVRTQRLSSLGALVAGVAHELNTPIGNALLTSSTLEQLSAEFDLKRTQKLTRSTLEHYAQTVAEISRMLMSNLSRAVELINGFKQLAVDQSSYQRRSFDLRTGVDEVLLTLSPALRRSSHEVVVDIPEPLQLDSFPGPLGQVLINLINNALLHAFEGHSQGHITVSARPDGPEHLLMCVSDDGSGIPPENLLRIFDPFFTTRLGQGGSGLGLHICFSLVKGLLGGSIEAGASAQGGAAFTLRLPRTAPISQVSSALE